MRDFPGSLVVKTSPFNAGDSSSTPAQGANVSHASWPKNQNINRCNTVTNSRKIFKMVHSKKKKKKKVRKKKKNLT